MKKILALSALATVFLAGCAATNGGNGQATAAAPAGKVAYCSADRLERAADSLTCNWAGTAKEACNSRARVTLRANTVGEGPSKGGMCSNGDRLVYVTTK
jgi:hypothetical protein